MSEYEAEFWGRCLNTYDEESKQYAYARRMGIRENGGFGFSIDGARVLDIGAGPTSMLLKATDAGRSAVLDPLMETFPFWVRARYAEARIATYTGRGEDAVQTFGHRTFDEVWIYNVLQHVDDPGDVIANARALARTTRIFEWIGIDAYAGHPHTLSIDDLNDWLGGQGTCERINEKGAVGVAYFGCFT